MTPVFTARHYASAAEAVTRQYCTKTDKLGSRTQCHTGTVVI